MEHIVSYHRFHRKAPSVRSWRRAGIPQGQEGDSFTPDLRLKNLRQRMLLHHVLQLHLRFLLLVGDVRPIRRWLSRIEGRQDP